MSKLPIPDIAVGSVFELTPEFLNSHNIEMLLIDLDNTLASYSQERPAQETRDWVRTLTRAGVRLHIVSNNRGDRPEHFARSLGIGFIKHAKKPFTAEIRKLLAELDANPSTTALVGDQIYTDILCARLIGIISIVVIPISMKNPLIRIRFVFERPFRAAYERRKKNEQDRKG